MVKSVRDDVTANLKKVKEEGQLRTERIRDIVRSSVAEAIAELRAGSSEIRAAVKEAMLAVLENVNDRGTEAKQDISASLEGAIEAVSHTRRGAIAKIEAEIDALQTKLDAEEAELDTQIDAVLDDTTDAGQGMSATINDTVQSAVEGMKRSPEAALMRQRYAQLRAQLSVLRANLLAQYGEHSDDIQRYLDDAKRWYQRVQVQAEAQAGQTNTYLEQKQATFETRMSEAGRAIAQKEKQVKQRLHELWLSMFELFRTQ